MNKKEARAVIIRCAKMGCANGYDAENRMNRNKECVLVSRVKEAMKVLEAKK